MCTTYFVRKGDDEIACDTIAELRQALGGEIVTDSIYGGEVMEDSCLCPVDPDGTAALHGLAMRWTTLADPHPFDSVILEARPTPEAKERTP